MPMNSASRGGRSLVSAPGFQPKRLGFARDGRGHMEVGPCRPVPEDLGRGPLHAVSLTGAAPSAPRQPRAPHVRARCSGKGAAIGHISVAHSFSGHLQELKTPSDG